MLLSKIYCREQAASRAVTRYSLRAGKVRQTDALLRDSEKVLKDIVLFIYSTHNLDVLTLTTVYTKPRNPCVLLHHRKNEALMSRKLIYPSTQT